MRFIIIIYPLTARVVGAPQMVVVVEVHEVKVALKTNYLKIYSLIVLSKKITQCSLQKEQRPSALFPIKQSVYCPFFPVSL